MMDKPDRFCELDGYRIAYHSEGRGEPVICIHGITTYSFIWQALAPLLADDHQVIRIDLLGCGQSDKPLEVPYSIKHHAGLLRRLMDRLQIDKAHLVCHDVGGGIGQRFAVHFPERVMDLTLINTVAYDFWPVQPIIAMRTPIIRQLAMAILDIGAFRHILRRGFYHKHKLTPDLLEYFFAPMRTRSGRKGFLHFAECLNNQHLLEIEDQLHGLDLPVLVIRGDADLYLSGAIAETLVKNLINSRLFKIATAGHFAQIDEPEIIAREIKRFYDSNP